MEQIEQPYNYKRLTWVIILSLLIAIIIVTFMSNTLRAQSEPLNTLKQAQALQKASAEQLKASNESKYMEKWTRIKASADAVTTLKMTAKDRANSEANVIAIACQQGF